MTDHREIAFEDRVSERLDASVVWWRRMVICGL
jgi:hypothetical protein